MMIIIIISIYTVIIKPQLKSIIAMKGNFILFLSNQNRFFFPSIHLFNLISSLWRQKKNSGNGNIFMMFTDTKKKLLHIFNIHMIQNMFSFENQEWKKKSTTWTNQNLNHFALSIKQTYDKKKLFFSDFHYNKDLIFQNRSVRQTVFFFLKAVICLHFTLVIGNISSSAATFVFQIVSFSHESQSYIYW